MAKRPNEGRVPTSPPWDPYRTGTMRREIEQELRRVSQKQYRQKRGLDNDPYAYLGKKEGTIMYLVIEIVESLSERVNSDLKKIYENSRLNMDDMRKQLDALYRQTVEAEKRLKAASTQYEAAIFKSIEETSEALNGTYQRMTSMDQNLVKQGNVLKNELQAKLNSVSEKFDAVQNSINASLKENKERIAYLWQQLEDSEKRIKDSQLTTEKSVLSGLEKINASLQMVQGKIIEINDGVEHSKEDVRADLLQVGNELMESIHSNQTILQDLLGKNAKFNEIAIREIKENKVALTKEIKLAADLGKAGNERLDVVTKRLTEIDAKLDGFFHDLSEKLDEVQERQEKTFIKETTEINNNLTAVKGDIEVQKHIVLDALKGRR